MRGTPQLVQLFLAYYGLPLIVKAINAYLGTGFNITTSACMALTFPPNGSSGFPP